MSHLDKTPPFIPTGKDQRPAESPVFGLVVLLSPSADSVDRQFLLLETLSVGRVDEAGVSVQVNDRLLSRKHFTLSRTRGQSVGFTIEDHQSTNGTFVGGQAVTSQALPPDTVIRVGETLLWFGEIAPVPLQGEALFAGQSLALFRVLQRIRRVAPSKLPVVILGETGTGKDLIARRLHADSGRSGPYIVVNCATIPSALADAQLFGHKKGAFTGATQDAPGYFAAADGGTLFLDEIGELPLELQPKLLRAVENSEITPVGGQTPNKFDVRIIAATNVELREAVDEGVFRRDLYARLAGETIIAPPLGDRRSDILLLLRRFMREAGGPSAISLEAAQALLAYDWPMNVRELSALGQRLALDGPDRSLVLADLPPEIAEHKPARQLPLIPPPTKDELLATLAAVGGNIAEVASHYGRQRLQVYRWLKAFGLDANAFRPKK